jgi:hypothetical protein
MAACDCDIKNNLLVYELLNNIDNTVFNYDLADYIKPYDVSYSGVWMPYFHTTQPKSIDGSIWKEYTSNTCQSSTPNGLGVANFLYIPQTQGLKNWSVTGPLFMNLDWVVNFQPCANYNETILFWYRYWDINRENDNRLVPGVDLYISDGDFAIINGAPNVTDNLKNSARLIKQSLTSAKITCDVDWLSKLLSSGPQIDWVTEILTGAGIDECEKFEPGWTVESIQYPRDEYYRILPFLKLMSDKPYNDIGTNNYIQSKSDLIYKLVSKCGLQLVIPPNSTTIFTSNFTSDTGPNISISSNQQLFVPSNNPGAGYSVAYSVGDLLFKAAPSGFVNPIMTKYNSTVLADTHRLNTFTLNDKVLGYNLSPVVSGTFDPNISNIQFHGFGGVKINTDIKLGQACDNEFNLNLGGVISITMINGGSDYTSPPTVSIQPSASDSGAGGATGIAVIGDGALQEINIINPGKNYFTPPKVYIVGGGGTGATAVAQVSEDGLITNINLQNRGTGYYSQPTIYLIGCGTEGVAEAELTSSGQVTRVIITNPGSGFTKSPSISFSGGGGSGAQAKGTVAGTQHEFQEDTGELPKARYCSGSTYGQQTVNIPDGLGSGPYYVRITGNVSDDLLVNGTIIDCGRYASGTYKCNNDHSIDYLFKTSSSFFTIAVKNNFGGIISYNLKITFSGSAKYNNTKQFDDKPFFIDNYRPANRVYDTFETGPAAISIGFTTASNSQLRIKENFNLNYLRSASKPSCPAFIETNSQECDCQSLTSIHPNIGIQQASNEFNNVGIPNTSTYYLPSGMYYGGLLSNLVGENGIIIPGHPSPGTPLPKSHAPIFPSNESCKYSRAGCGNGTVYFDIPYPATLKLTTQASKGKFSLLWNGKAVTSTKTGSDELILTKSTASPASVQVTFGGATADDPEIQWGVSLDAIQNTYTQQVVSAGFSMVGSKGFFHPNFGWTYDSRYSNKTAVLPQGTTVLATQSISYGSSVNWGGYCNPQIAGEKIITIPNNIALPVYVNIKGFVDDDLVINGDVIEPGKYPYWIFPCNGAHNVDYTFLCNERSFTVAAADNIGGWVGYNLDIKFQSATNYFYSAYSMYDEEYLEGYNFIFNETNLSVYQKENIAYAKYLGIPTQGGAYLVTDKWRKIRYTPTESLILDLVPFEYINLDYFVNDHGRFINDLIYEQVGVDSIRITSLDGTNRATSYFDIVNPTYQTWKVVLYSRLNLNKNFEATINYIQDNIIYLRQNLPSKNIDQGIDYSSGLIRKINEELDDYVPSILVLRPYKTVRDDYISVGKWGNMSYGKAALNATQALPKYNNSTLRTSVYPNTYFTWGVPLAFYNGYDPDNKSYYFPLTRIWAEKYSNQRILHVLGQNNQYPVGNPNPQGDMIISSGSISGRQDYIYVGTYTGPIRIEINIDRANSIQTQKYDVVLYYNGSEVSRQRVNNNNQFTFYSNKSSYLGLYAIVKIEQNQSGCTNSNTAYITGTVSLRSYSVIANTNNNDLKQTTRLCYHKHETINKDSMFPKSLVAGIGGALTLCNTKIAPLSYNKDTTNFNLLKTKDFSPLLDLHIFSSLEKHQPVKSNGGIVFFEDFLQPKPLNFSMQIPYNENFFWIDIPHNTEWQLLTKKGIIFKSNQVYKVLKKLKYTCQGDASLCSSRYKKNICQDEYSLSIGDLWDKLGLTAQDSQYFDVVSVSFPGDCGNIDYCCEPGDWNCANSQAQQRDRCYSFWNDYKVDVNCQSATDPNTNPQCLDSISQPTNAKGTIRATTEYFVLKLKENILPYLHNITNPRFHFFRNASTVPIPCTSTTLNSVGTSFLVNYFCNIITDKCEYIFPKDYSLGSEYTPGNFIDLSPSILDPGNAIINTPPLSVILSNEEKYRSIVSHPNNISPPLKEYDPEADTKYCITKTFTIKGTDNCIAPGLLFRLEVDNFRCQFSLDKDIEGNVSIKSCFDDLTLKTKDNNATFTVSRTIAEGTFSCNSNGDPVTGGSPPDNFFNQQDFSCSDANNEMSQRFGPDWEENYTLVGCKDISKPEDYYLACRYCGPKPCGHTLSYQEAAEQECHCPKYADLADSPTGGKTCTYSVDLSICELGQYDGYCTKYTVKTVPLCGGYLNDGLCTVAPSCFAKIDGPTEQELRTYEDACANVDPQYIKEFEVSRSILDGPISILDDDPADTVGIYNKNIEEQARINNENCQVYRQQSECNNNCNQYQDQTARSNCYCQCSCQSSLALAQIANSREWSIGCRASCNTSDGITDGSNYGYNWNGYYNYCGYYYGGFCYYYGWWYNYGTCTASNGEVSRPPCNLSHCAASSFQSQYQCNGENKSGSDYSPCSNLEDRLTIYQGHVSSCQCTLISPQEGQYFIPYYRQDQETSCYRTKTNIETLTPTQHSHYTRERKAYTKTKTVFVPQDKAKELTESVKIRKKTYEISYKNKQDQDNPPGQCPCYGQESINITIKVEVYHNLIIAFFGSGGGSGSSGTGAGVISGSSSRLNKICLPRNTSNKFKCPVVKYTPLNSKLLMCDTTSVKKSNCVLGSI